MHELSYVQCTSSYSTMHTVHTTMMLLVSMLGASLLEYAYEYSIS